MKNARHAKWILAVSRKRHFIRMNITPILSITSTMRYCQQALSKLCLYLSLKIAHSRENRHTKSKNFIIYKILTYFLSYFHLSKKHKSYIIKRKDSMKEGVL